MDQQYSRSLLSATKDYRRSSGLKACWQLANTLIPLVAVYWLGITGFDALPALSCLLALFAAGLIVRSFMLQHDCAHQSFFPNRTLNNITGFLLGILTLTPHACWRRNHLLHHGGTSDLDKRGVGDIRTSTTKEFGAMSQTQKIIYRVYRHPVVLFGLGSFIFFLFWQRLTHFLPKKCIKERISVLSTNLALILVAGSVYFFFENAWHFFAFHFLAMFIATSVGVWLFYVQHQFPDAYWVQTQEWTHVSAAMLGASFYDLHPVLHWFTANIGYHHIHHLDTRIPNYLLPQCHRGQPDLAPPIRFKFFESLKFSKLRLWDEDKQRMVGFPVNRNSAQKRESA